MKPYHGVYGRNLRIGINHFIAGNFNVEYCEKQDRPYGYENFEVLLINLSWHRSPAATFFSNLKKLYLIKLPNGWFLVDENCVHLDESHVFNAWIKEVVLYEFENESSKNESESSSVKSV